MKQLHLSLNGNLGDVKKTEPTQNQPPETTRALSDVMEGMGNPVAFAKAAPDWFWDGMKLDD